MPVPTQQVKLALHVLVFLLLAAADRHHVRHVAVGGIDRREHVVEQRPLLEVGVEGVGAQREQAPRELEHVVHVARSRRCARPRACSSWSARAEVLRQPVAAAGVAVVLHHAVPEERRRHQVAGVARVAVALRRADELGDLAVAVLAVEVVLPALERIGERVVLEPERQREPPLVAGVGVEVGQHFVHAAVLGVEHLCDLRIGERRQDPLGPAGELQFPRRAPWRCRCGGRRRAGRRRSCAACTRATTCR